MRGSKKAFPNPWLDNHHKTAMNTAHPAGRDGTHPQIMQISQIPELDLNLRNLRNLRIGCLDWSSLLQLVLLGVVPEGAIAHAEQFGGTGADAARLLQGRLDVSTLDFSDVLLKVHAALGN